MFGYAKLSKVRMRLRSVGGGGNSEMWWGGSYGWGRGNSEMWWGGSFCWRKMGIVRCGGAGWGQTRLGYQHYSACRVSRIRQVRSDRTRSGQVSRGQVSGRWSVRRWRGETTPFSGQFSERQWTQFGNSAGNFGGSEFRRPFGHDSAGGLSKLVALLLNSTHNVHNWSEKGVLVGSQWQAGKVVTKAISRDSF